MSPPHQKIYQNNIRINLFDASISDERTTANATKHYLSTDNTDEVLPAIYNYFHSLMKEYGGNQIDFVIDIRISGTKHRLYFEDAAKQLERQRELNKKSLAKRNAANPNYKPRVKPTYKYKSWYKK